MNYIIRKFELLFILIFIFKIVYSQIPTTQDCLGAIPVCDYVYVEEFTASGEGNYGNEIPSGQTCPNHCMDGEKNTRWYTWTVVESGDLRLTITPATSSDDYDWAVFDLTNWSCEDIYSHPIQMMVSCNAAGYTGVTGISSFLGGVLSCYDGGNTNKWCADLPVYEGETYALVVSDWTQTPGGYTLDFSSSSAVIFDDQEPFIDHLGNDEITACGTNGINIYFNENIKCNSIQSDDFLLEGPGGPYVIDSIYGENCELGGVNEPNFTAYFTPAITQSGNYSFIIKTSSYLSDACNNYAFSDTLDFAINLDTPLTDAGEDIDIAYGDNVVLDGSASGGSEDFSFHWEPADLVDNPDIQNPTTTSLTISTQFILKVTDNISTCEGEDTMWVNVVGGPLTLQATVDNNNVCDGDLINLSAMPEGGSGNYTYEWSSDPVGFYSTQQNPSDYPNENTTYYVEVTDGITSLESSVSIVVNPPPIAEAGEDIDIELGNTTPLNGSAYGGSGDYSFRWEPASWLEQNDIANPVTLLLPQTTKFTLFVTDNISQCTSETDEMFVVVSSDILSASPNASPDVICKEQYTLISSFATGGGGGYEYNWTSTPPGFNSTESSFSVSPNVTTTYNLHLTDQFGNEFNGATTVIVNPLPIIELMPSLYPPYGLDTINVCVRDTVILDAGFDSDPPTNTYYWKTDNYENRFLTVASGGSWINYQYHDVVVTNGNTGCIDSSHITIIFDYNVCEISVPEQKANLRDIVSVLPNPNDGKFLLNFKESVSDLELKIYDSRGLLLYSKFISGKHLEGTNISIDSGLREDGVYILVFQTASDYIVKKMIIQGEETKY